MHLLNTAVSRAILPLGPASGISEQRKHTIAPSERNDTSPECLFCGIAQGLTSAHVVFEDRTSLAFLDHRPVFLGHVLLVPRKHIETLGDLPESMTGPLFTSASVLSRAVQAAMKAEGTFIAINNRVSQSVPHLHVHIVPRTRGDGLRGFLWPRTKYRDEAHAEEVRKAIADAVGDQLAGR